MRKIYLYFKIHILALKINLVYSRPVKRRFSMKRNRKSIRKGRFSARKMKTGFSNLKNTNRSELAVFGWRLNFVFSVEPEICRKQDGEPWFVQTTKCRRGLVNAYVELGCTRTSNETHGLCPELSLYETKMLHVS